MKSTHNTVFDIIHRDRKAIASLANKDVYCIIPRLGFVLWKPNPLFVDKLHIRLPTAVVAQPQEWIVFQDYVEVDEELELEKQLKELESVMTPQAPPVKGRASQK